MKAVEIPEPGAEFEVVERDVPEPDAEEVRVAVEACGICHSDAFVKEGQWPGVDYPRVPGHEVAGRVDAVGEDVTEWEEGDRVGVGWHGGHCFTCDACRRGDFIACENAQVTGFDYDGGYAEYLTAPHEALAKIPDELDAVDAAPLLCAGITTFNSLRNSEARPGDLVAVQGVGGLGHLGIQYAYEAGFETVAVSTSPEKEDLAYELGADHFIDASEVDAGEELQSMGGAKVVLATAPSADAMSSIVSGVGVDGKLLTIAVPGEPLSVDVQPLVTGRRSVGGWPSGTPHASEDTLDFSALRDVTPKVETFSLEEADDAYAAMMDNEVRFRAVLVPE
ncbi:zinc-binding dehydrogenase family oxidoreductase [Halogeometricum pallidum JCM 14848]|uniref:Zinc-binding dehydrogenase family oxidoreductase n=1 Tax=Halogeometricum pallidum JCM 14848 TaxID=1227487 RepID=M0DEY6_HALPD|nr:alcohol dehydrogenase [Halogeometricum pallidum]ELZ33307.1 zinc-binding dehydrogenase family oxidoreductase [Halogeometricum pallidum JCM 14848]